ncbi:hypothetical protein [Microbacterium oleivorans]|uniref:Uncharacterized protein n=1 Tax=Microbacterium oleivorans TaxID=273677 RepID=A0A177KAQ5_9MICO|nr:hypothetical protein [Microbacterium oleivorans]OAH50224.1 hypothetical protein AYL44_07090 [Microbacterium oleivorans]
MTTAHRTTTLGTILVVVSGVGVLVAAGALATFLVTPDSTTTELAIVVGGAGTATVAGIAGVCLHRIRVVVSLLATLGYLLAGAILTVGAAAILHDAAQGGFANIGAAMLLLVGAVIALPALALTLALAFFVVRDGRRRAVTA